VLAAALVLIRRMTMPSLFYQKEYTPLLAPESAEYSTFYHVRSSINEGVRKELIRLMLVKNSEIVLLFFLAVVLGHIGLLAFAQGLGNG
jgi:hypothetical protein